MISSTQHTTLRASPAQLVFGRDMFLPVKFVEHWALIQKQKQKRAQINKCNQIENSLQIPITYQLGDTVLLTCRRPIVLT